MHSNQAGIGKVTRLILSKKKEVGLRSRSVLEGREEEGSPYNCDLWKGVAAESLLPREGGREGGRLS